MNDADRKAAEQQYSVTAFDYASSPIGSRDWTLYWNGWQAACEWRDIQVGEPYLWMTEWWAEGSPDNGEYEYETNHINEFSCGRKKGFPLYRHPPVVQINQQMREALKDIAATGYSNIDRDKARAALAAAKSGDV